MLFQKKTTTEPTTEPTTTDIPSSEISPVDNEKFGEIVDTAEMIKADRAKSENEPVSASASDIRLGKSTRSTRRKKYKKRTPTRKPVSGEQADETPKPFEVLDRSLCMMIAGLVPFGIVASFMQDSKWLLTDEEKLVLASQWDLVITKYLPDVIEEYGPEFSLVGIIGLYLVQKSGAFDPKPIGPENE